MELPIGLADFYKYAVFVMFGIVIAESFPVSASIFIPVNKLTTYDGIENALTLILAYFFILTSWVGYFRSITLNPHTDTKLGMSRFIVDLFIVFLYFYFLSQVPGGMKHGEIFVWTLPTIFGTFLLWDFLRYLEYRRIKKEPRRAHATRKNRLIRTGSALAVFLTMSYLYEFGISMVQLTINDGVSVWNTPFILASLIIVFLYRWKTFEHPRRRTQQKGL